MKRKLGAGSTSEMMPIFVLDNTKTDGSGLGSLTSVTAGLVAEYRRKGSAAWTTITKAAGTLGTYTSGGWIADGSIAGAYEVGIPDAALAAGVAWVLVRYSGATAMNPVMLEIELDALNYQDGSRLGLTALPNAVPGSAGGVFIAGTNAPTIITTSLTTHLIGAVDTVTNLTNAPTAGDLTATMKASVTTAATGATPTISLPAIPANWITAAGINAAALNGKGDWSTYAGADTAGTTTLLARLTAPRSANLDFLDASVSSRSTYAGGAVASVSGNVGGNVVGSVGAVATGGIVATSFAADAISTAAVSAGAVTKIQAGLSTYSGGAVASVSGSVGSIGTGGITSLSFGAGAITAASIATDAINANALASDAVAEIWSKAMTELSAVPGVNASVLAALSWIFEVARNKITQTSTTQALFKDDGSTPLASSTVSDDGATFTRGKFV